MKPNKKWIGLVVLCCSLTLGLAFGQEGAEAIPKIKAQVRHAALFKNGIGVVVMGAPLPSVTDGFYQVSPVPHATFGSFWIVNPEGSQVTDVILTKARTEEEVPAATLYEMLEANLGKTADLLIGDTWQRLTIKEIPKRHEGPVLPLREEGIIPPPPPQERGEILIVKDGDRVRVLPLASIREMRLDPTGSGYALTMPKEEEVIQFRIAFPNPDPQAKPEISFLALVKGLAWAPSYVIDISQDDEATVLGKAVVINDLAPMQDTVIELITGVPNIAFENVDSAFSLNPLQQIIGQIMAGRPQENAQVARRGVMAQAVLSNAVMMDSFGGVHPSAPLVPVEGEQTEDLFFYQLDPLTLKKGERAYQVLFSDSIPYEHLYTWEIADQINTQNRYMEEQQQPKEQVWHSIKLTNLSGQPWTTAPAITMKNNRVLGQETMFYTPPKASTEVKITQAVSIKAEQNEYEVERRRSAATFYGMPYDLVTVKGILEIVNYKGEAVKIKITKHLSGEVTSTMPETEVQAKANKLNQVNPSKQLIWTLDLQPGLDKKTTIEYTYTAYVRG